ncbi:fimbrial protein, partial [Serratia marcescens]|uniref:fimbrial protein n=1 Tax=Serratia marcescens TaxID=615 RepID=UPI0011E8829A
TGGRGTIGVWTGTAFNGSATPVYNSITLTLNSTSGVVDSGNGIMGINSGTESSATGIGIQLMTDKTGASPAQIGVPIVNILPTDGTVSYDLPLFARYIQTGNSVTPGAANGLLTYTIEYK